MSKKGKKGKKGGGKGKKGGMLTHNIFSDSNQILEKH